MTNIIVQTYSKTSRWICRRFVNIARWRLCWQLMWLPPTRWREQIDMTEMTASQRGWCKFTQTQSWNDWQGLLALTIMPLTLPQYQDTLLHKHTYDYEVVTVCRFAIYIYIYIYSLRYVRTLLLCDVWVQLKTTVQISTWATRCETHSHNALTDNIISW